MRLRILTLFLALSLLGAAPALTRAADVGAELRFYPAGMIPALRADLGLAETDRVILQVGYNLTNRQDWGVHQSEKGGGPGIGVGWMHDFGRDPRGWLLGARADIWWLEIDWEDPGASGTTRVTVLQPTVGGGFGALFRL